MKRYISPNDYKLLQEKYPQTMEEILQKIDNNYPIQYLIGDVNFYGYTIKVKEGVLIPRFETETLVDNLLKLIKEKKDLKIIDIGTGTGCIAITLSKELDITVDALDISKLAYNLAKENIILNNAKVNLYQGDLNTFSYPKKYNVLVSNPPYVSSKEPVDPATFYEPSTAIYSNDNGLEHLTNILKRSKDILEEKNIIALEIGMMQGSYLTNLAKEIYPNGKIILLNDLSNRPRYFFIINE